MTEPEPEPVEQLSLDEELEEFDAWMRRLPLPSPAVDDDEGKA